MIITTSIIHQDINIDNSLHGFLIGSKLGDGAFVKKSDNHNTYIVYKHSEKQYNYLLWKYNFLMKNEVLNKNKIIKESKLVNCYNTQNKQYYFSTKSLKELNYYKTTSLSKLISEINIIGLIIWIFDDGSFDKNGMCRICFPNKTYEEKYIVLNTLSRKFSLSCYLYEYEKNHSKDNIMIRSNNYHKLKQCAFKLFKNDKIIEEKMRW